MRSLSPRAAGMLSAAVVAVAFVAEIGGPNGILGPPGSEYTDLLITHWPNAHFLRQSVWRDHTWPLWNPMLFSGTPFAANPLSGIWYPPNWLFLVLPITPGFNLLLLAHLVLAAVGAARLVARLSGPGGGWIGPLVGGLAWGLAPRIWGSLGAGHVGAVYALGWMPWIVEAAIAQLSARRRWMGGRLAILMALQFLADPRIVVYTGMILIALVGWDSISALRNDTSGLKGMALGKVQAYLLPWTISALFAIGLSAVLWLPMADLVPYTTRATLSLDESAVYSLPVARLAGLVWPNRGGFHEWVTYLGAGVLWLAFLGWLARSRRVRWAVGLAWILLIGVAFGTNGPLYPILARLPGVDLLRVPARAWYILAFCAAILAGLGAGELASGAKALRPHRRGLGRITLIVTAFVGFLGLGVSVIVPEVAAKVNPLWGFGWLLAAVGVSLGAISGGLPRIWVVVGLVLVVAVDLLWMDSSLVQRIPADNLCAEDATAAHQLGESGGRIYAPSFRPVPYIAAQAGLRIVNGVDPIQLATYAQFMNTAAGVSEAAHYNVALPPLPDHINPRLALAAAKPDHLLLSLLDVRAVVSQFPLSESFLTPVSPGTGGDLNIYLSPVSIPWPAVFSRVEVVGDLQEALETLTAEGIDQQAVVRGGYALDGLPGYEPANLIDITPNCLLIKARGPGLLVVSEVVHPGWVARVDGETATVYEANGILRGVYLASGDHMVEMIYRPPAVFWGLGISLFSLGGLVTTRRWSRRRDP